MERTIHSLVRQMHEHCERFAIIAEDPNDVHLVRTCHEIAWYLRRCLQIMGHYPSAAQERDPELVKALERFWRGFLTIRANSGNDFSTMSSEALKDALTNICTVLSTVGAGRFADIPTREEAARCISALRQMCDPDNLKKFKVVGPPPPQKLNEIMLRRQLRVV